jgi:hypothetical protein
MNNDIDMNNDNENIVNIENELSQSIDKCIFNNSDYDIATVCYKFLKDKHRYVKNNVWEYLITYKNGNTIWGIDINNQHIAYSIKTIICSAFTKRSLYWSDKKGNDIYYDTELISLKLLNISSKLKDNKYISVLIKECKQFFII